MIGKVKKWFGIEGLKIGLILKETYKRKEGKIQGSVVMESMNDEEIISLHIKIIEKYSRGRGKSKLIDEYTMGELILDGPFYVQANEITELDFNCHIREHVSEMDMLERGNFLYSGVAKVAKFIKKASSTDRIEAEAKVKGTKFNPFAKENLEFS